MMQIKFLKSSLSGLPCFNQAAMLHFAIFHLKMCAILMDLLWHGRDSSWLPCAGCAGCVSFQCSHRREHGCIMWSSRYLSKPGAYILNLPVHCCSSLEAAVRGSAGASLHWPLALASPGMSHMRDTSPTGPCSFKVVVINIRSQTCKVFGFHLTVLCE